MKQYLWKADVAQSIDFYNDWFLRFAPGAYRAATVNADRLCGATADRIIKAAREKRQLAALTRWLLRHGYRQIASDEASNLDVMHVGTFTFHRTLSAGKKKTPANIPIDCIVKPLRAGERDQSFVIEVKSSGDATITNRRRKKEAQKFTQLKERYGENVEFILLLCGHFDPFYLGHQAAEGIDWVWEHRLEDLSAYFVRRNNKRIASKSTNCV